MRRRVGAFGEAGLLTKTLELMTLLMILGIAFFLMSRKVVLFALLAIE